MARLPKILQSQLESLLSEQLRDAKGKVFDFTQPVGAEAWLHADSVSWKIFSNPVSLLIGGIAAVLLELAEPRVRTGVWEHTTFRSEPLARMRHTGLAAMITVYAPRDSASKMIAGVSRMHDRVQGVTPNGQPYRANDPQLLNWVHATACFGFLQAYHHYVQPLSDQDRDQFYAEGIHIAKLYGAEGSPRNEREFQELLNHFRPTLEPSIVLREFVDRIENVELIPSSHLILNSHLLAAAVDLLPLSLQKQLALDHHTLNPLSRKLLRSAANWIQTLELCTSPYHQSLKRMGKPNSESMR